MMEIEPTQEALAAIAHEAGYDWYCCTHFTALPAMGLEQSPRVISNFALAFSDHYAEQNYIEHDAITYFLLQRRLSIGWAEAEQAFEKGSLQRLMFDEAREFRIQCGISYSFDAGMGQIFGVNFARSSRPLAPPSKASQLHLLSNVNSWMRGYFQRHDVSAGITLTPAMQNVLRGLIRAKSNKEIARDLGITAEGVKKHIIAIGSRLPEPTQKRTSIVSQALRIGLARKYGLQ